LTANWPATLFFFSALFTTPTAHPVENLCAINRHFRVFTLANPDFFLFFSPPKTADPLKSKCLLHIPVPFTEIEREEKLTRVLSIDTFG
jgi:hypothetical protein